MAKRSPIDELDLAVQVILAGSGEPLPPAGARNETLVTLASALRHLPNEEFKARLKADLQERGSMSTAKSVNPVRKGFRTITPYLQAFAAPEMIEYVKKAFGGEELHRAMGGAGGIHAEVRIGDSMLMLGGGGTWKGPERPVGILLSVDDADATYKRALNAGGISIYEPVTQPHGDRDAGVKDPGGNFWYITTRRPSDHTPPDQPDIVLGFNPHGAAQLIEFMKIVFGAETVFRRDEPDGTVGHARLRIGNSIVIASEPRGQYQPMPPAVYVYVEDADAVYKRALDAGATPLYPMADQPWGDRLGGVTDPFGNEWYIATHIKDMGA